MSNDINLELINSLTAEDTKTILKLSELRDEAEKAYGIIRNKIKFSIGEDKIEIWNDTNNAEYITHKGVWQARYLHQTYDVTCTVEGIFNVFKEEYLDSLKHSCMVNNVADSARYFRSFVDGLKKK